MKRNSFEESEVPYQTLAKFGLTHEMIEDLPMHALDDISNGRPSPVLPVSMEGKRGLQHQEQNTICLGENGRRQRGCDVLSCFEVCPIGQFHQGAARTVEAGQGSCGKCEYSRWCNPIKAFVQIDGETNQVMAVPTPVIGRNLQVLSDELSLGGTELKSIQNGEALTFAVEDEPVTVGIDLKSDTGIRFANGDGEQWRKEGKREWDKYTFGIYGCWVMDDDGNLDYIPEEEYTEELME